MQKIAIGNLIQAAVLGAITAWLAPRWVPAAVLMGLAGALQLAAAVLLLARKQRGAVTASALTLVLVAILIGLAGHAAVHAMTRFGDDARAIGEYTLLGFGLALPWVAAWPLWQVLAGRGAT